MLHYIPYPYQEMWASVSESIIEKMPCHFGLLSLQIAKQNCCVSNFIHWFGVVWGYCGLLMGAIVSLKVGYSNAYKKLKEK